MNWELLFTAIKSDMGTTIALIFTWIGFLLGGLVMKKQNCKKHGYSFFLDRPIIDPLHPDEKMSYGIQVGLTAGWYAATDEEEDYNKIRSIYLRKIAEQEVLNGIIHSGDSETGTKA